MKSFNSWNWFTPRSSHWSRVIWSEVFEGNAWSNPVCHPVCDGSSLLHSPRGPHVLQTDFDLLDMRNCSLYVQTIYLYSQTWVNDHLRMSCLQRPLFLGRNFSLCNTKLPLNNDQLSTTTTNFGSRGWSLYTSLTVFKASYGEKVWLYLILFVSD